MATVTSTPAATRLGAAGRNWMPDTPTLGVTTKLPGRRSNARSEAWMWIQNVEKASEKAA